MKNTEKKPASLFKLMKAFWIYEAVLVILLILFPIVSKFDYGVGFFNCFPIYIPILFIGAPTLFGIWFGYTIEKKYCVPFGKKIMISVLIFILNYFTYWIPNIASRPWDYFRASLYPATGLTISFIITSIVTSAIYRKVKNKE